MKFGRSFSVVAAVLLLACGWRTAHAYRPFDGSDAAVADLHQIEIELGPAEYLRDGAQRTLFAPSTVLNYGFAPGWEGVVEGRATHPLSGGGAAAAGLADAGAFLKGVLRDGALQDKAGPSVATEFGVLLPGIHADHGVGASVAGIVSQRWNWATIHLNAAASITRQQHPDLFLGTIIEGPHDWTVRPVAEVFYDRDFGATASRSALVGTIWQVTDDVAADFGLRGARTRDHTSGEIRAGVTFAFGTR